MSNTALWNHAPHQAIRQPGRSGTTPSLTRCDVEQQSHRAELRDRGQAAIVVIAVAAVLLVSVAAALGVMGRATIDRTRAQTAADAAALASLDGGRAAADDLAERHGASVVTWFRGPGSYEVTVTVRLGASSATARASNAP